MVTHCCLEDRPLFLIRIGVLSALCVKLPVHTLTPTANRLTEALKQGRELAVCILDSIIFCLLFYLKYLEIHVNKHPQYFPEVTSTRSSHLSIKHLGVYLQHTATWWQVPAILDTESLCSRETSEAFFIPRGVNPR